jgi:hypothetical protein
VSTVTKSQATMLLTWRRENWGRLVGGAARSGLEPVVAENLSDGAGRHPIAEAEKFASDALAAPPRIACGQSNNHRHQLVGEGSGRPLGVVSKVQCCRTVPRCQRSSVSGRTRNTDQWSRGRSRLKSEGRARSLASTRGLGCCRRRTLSWCRKTRLSISFEPAGRSRSRIRANMRLRARYTKDDNDKTPTDWGAREHGDPNRAARSPR